MKAIKAELERTAHAKCWMDLEGIESGVPRFTKNIIDGIRQTSVFLFMRSKDSQVSEFALKELNYATKRDKHVVIVNIDNSVLTEEFEFLYGLTDTITWENEPQKNKLFRDIAKWLQKPTEDAKPLPKEEKEEIVDDVSSNFRTVTIRELTA